MYGWDRGMSEKTQNKYNRRKGPAPDHSALTEDLLKRMLEVCWALGRPSPVLASVTSGRVTMSLVKEMVTFHPESNGNLSASNNSHIAEGWLSKQ